MGFDKQKIWRGKCNKCDCQEFIGKNVKCICGHVPTVHEISGDGGAAGPPRDRVEIHSQHSYIGALKGKNDLGTPHVTTVDYQVSHQPPVGYGDQSSPHVSSQQCITCRGVYPVELGICPYCPKEQCKNPSCKCFKFTDPMYGQFDYCSSGCRDKDLLPGYNKKLEKDLNEGYSSYARGNSLSPNESNGAVLLSSTRSTPPLTRPAITSTYAAVAASQNSKHDIRPSPQPTSNAGTFYSETAHSSQQGFNSDHFLKSSTSVCGGGSANNHQKSYSGQHTYAEEIPDLDNTHLFKTRWIEGDRIGLLITGITVGKETAWQWLDLITGIVYPLKRDFDKTMSYSDMISCIKKAAMVKTWRDKDFKPITEQIKRKVQNKDKMITFFVPRQTESQKYGLDDDKLGLLKVTPKSVADQCGIKDNDILQFFGVVHTTQLETFTLNEVKEKNTVTKACQKLKSSPNSVGLVLVVKRTGSEHYTT